MTAAKARTIAPDPSHANWFENFPWTRLALATVGAIRLHEQGHVLVGFRVREAEEVLSPLQAVARQSRLDLAGIGGGGEGGIHGGMNHLDRRLRDLGPSSDVLPR